MARKLRPGECTAAAYGRLAPAATARCDQFGL